MIIVHLILHSAVHIHNFHIFKTLNTYLLSIVVKKSFFLLKIRLSTPFDRSTYHQKDKPPPPCKEEVINCHVTCDTASSTPSNVTCQKHGRITFIIDF